jgi:hypothetical protein
LAQTIIDATQANGLVLDGLAGPVEIQSGVRVSSSGSAAVGASLQAQLSNAGQVDDVTGIGVTLGHGGALRIAV